MNIPLDIDAVKGFLAADEGEALYRYGTEAARLGPLLEIGSYCGKSTIYLGLAAKEQSSVVYAVDHHAGSEEHQIGEMFHDEDLVNETGAFDTFAEFRKNVRAAGVADVVVPLVAGSKLASKQWSTPLAMVFIDGGHSLEAALTDYRSWAPLITPGGILAIHDLFPNPEDGGAAPWAVYNLALASELFEPVERINSLGVLRRIKA